MRLEYSFELAKVEVPRFSVEAVEGIGKLFTLATLVLNVLASKPVVEIVFHGLNPEDPESKIEAFREIISGSEDGASLTLRVRQGRPRARLVELLPLAQDPGLIASASSFDFARHGTLIPAPAMGTREARGHDAAQARVRRCAEGQAGAVALEDATAKCVGKRIGQRGVQLRQLADARPLGHAAREAHALEIDQAGFEARGARRQEHVARLEIAVSDARAVQAQQQRARARLGRGARVERAGGEIGGDGRPQVLEPQPRGDGQAPGAAPRERRRATPPRCGAHAGPRRRERRARPASRARRRRAAAATRGGATPSPPSACRRRRRA